jgi:hypothetical protein
MLRVIFPHGNFLTQFEEEHVDAAMSKSSSHSAVFAWCKQVQYGNEQCTERPHSYYNHFCMWCLRFMPAAAAAYKSDSLMLIFVLCCCCGTTYVNAMHLCHKLCAWQVLFTISNYLKGQNCEPSQTLQFGH